MLDGSMRPGLPQGSPQARQGNPGKDNTLDESSAKLEERASGTGNALIDPLSGTKRPSTGVQDKPSTPNREGNLFNSSASAAPDWLKNRRITQYHEDLARANNVELVTVVCQNLYPGDPNVESPGRCLAVACAHLYAALNNDFASLEQLLRTPEGHTSLQMWQRGFITLIDNCREARADKYEELLTKRYGHLGLLTRTALGLPTPLAPADEQSLQVVDEELCNKVAPLYVPGATSARVTHSGQGSDLGAMITGLSPGHHLLTVTSADGKFKHAISCVVSNDPDIPSQLLDANACLWRGTQENLGRVLQRYWNEKGMLKMFSGSVRWQCMTFTRDQASAPN